MSGKRTVEQVIEDNIKAVEDYLDSQNGACLVEQARNMCIDAINSEMERHYICHDDDDSPVDIPEPAWWSPDRFRFVLCKRVCAALLLQNNRQAIEAEMRGGDDGDEDE